ncbi:MULTISPECIES: hypothetical protein [unclassified Azospirillum]|uniref:hypothetical protein n=1 Tax=unclassified Azospirillum TaxID=2630922 RepID=UPI000D64E9FD|nr:MULTISPECIES: hypothetical protein [unclassified Azospirillum]
MCGGGGSQSVPEKSAAQIASEERMRKEELALQQRQFEAQQAAAAAAAERERQAAEQQRQFQLMQLTQADTQARTEREWQAQQQAAAQERADRLAAEERARQDAAKAAADALSEKKLQAQMLRATGQAGALRTQLDAANAWDEDIFNQIAMAASSLYGQLGESTDNTAYSAITDLNNAATQRMIALNRTRDDLERQARTNYELLSKRNDITSLDMVDQIAAQYASLFDDAGKYKATNADDEITSIKAFLDKNRTRLQSEADAKKAQAAADAAAAGTQVKLVDPNQIATTTPTAAVGTNVAGGAPAVGANAFSASLGGAVNAKNPTKQVGWSSLF